MVDRQPVYQVMEKKGVLRNSKGFTLLESLLVFTVFIICSASLPLLYEGARQAFDLGEIEKNAEWELFIIQLRDELHASKNWHLYGGKLQYFSLGENDSIISVSKYEDKIRRQINGQGHEIMLQNVKDAFFSIKGGKLYIHVFFTNGEKEGASISPLYKPGN